MACKASLADQQNQVQENIHAQIKSFCMFMNEILIPDNKRIGDAHELPAQPTIAPRGNGQPTDRPGKVLFAIWKLFAMLHYELEVV